MDKYKKWLSEMYYLSTSRIIEETASLYERMHTDSGDPVEDVEKLKKEIKYYMLTIALEIDLARSSLNEFLEGNKKK
jgi:hypothetical protein